MSEQILKVFKTIIAIMKSNFSLVVMSNRYKRVVDG